MSKWSPFVIPGVVATAAEVRNRNCPGREHGLPVGTSPIPHLPAVCRHPRACGAPLGMTGALLLVLGVSAARAQENPLPFAAGERLHYSVSARKLGTIGEGVMSVDGPVDVRGTPTLVLRSEVQARVGVIKTSERSESWIDPTRMAALRYQKRTRGMFARGGEEKVELFPEEQRWEGRHGKGGHSPTAAPLDELSFIYYLRTLALKNDTVDALERHYNAARNPIGVRVVGRDTLNTKAGTFATIVVEMRVKDPDRYGGEGIIRLHLSDDVHRYPVRIESSVPILGATILTLESVTTPPQQLAGQPK
jgi:hypothetical protein